MQQTLTPAEIVLELDKYIIGQKDAKRMVAIALRNRWRRQQVPEHLRDEIAPKNIIMIGPTGVGKTEIARRLARLAQSPFLKIEASKFTEVGYVGRDVESMIRDLTELAVSMVRNEEMEAVKIKAEEIAEEKLLDILLPPKRTASTPEVREHPFPTEADALVAAKEEADQADSTREKLRKLLRIGDARRSLCRNRCTGPQFPDDRDFRRSRHGGDGLQPQGHARIHAPQAHQAAEGQDSRGPGNPHTGRISEADRHGQGD